MRLGTIFGFGLVVGTVLSAQACGGSEGKENGSGAKDGGSGGSSTGGGSGTSTGGSSSGGSSSQAGATGAGGAAITNCPQTTCQATADRLEQAAAALPIPDAGISIATCCISATQCGVTFGAFGGGQCVDPAQIPVPDGGFTFPTIPVFDGGIVPVDGGPDIHLDAACPGISLGGFFTLPGCCRPEGKCGGSTHPAAAFGGGQFPITCISNGELSSAFGDGGGGFFTVPPDPNVSCTY